MSLCTQFKSKKVWFLWGPEVALLDLHTQLICSNETFIRCYWYILPRITSPNKWKYKYAWIDLKSTTRWMQRQISNQFNLQGTLHFALLNYRINVTWVVQTMKFIILTLHVLPQIRLMVKTVPHMLYKGHVTQFWKSDHIWWVKELCLW